MKIEVITIKDINDKEITYIRVTNQSGSKHNINVGNKTAKSIQHLIDEDRKESQQQTDKSAKK